MKSQTKLWSLMSLFHPVICGILLVFIHGQALAAPGLNDLKALYPKTNNQTWNYTGTVSDDIGLRVERYENGTWKLLSFNNHPPTEKELKRYQEYLDNAVEQEERNDPVMLLPGLLDSLTSLELVNENEQQVIYRVPTKDLNSGENDDMHKYLQAELIFSKKKNAVTALRMKNIAPFKPAAMIKVINLQVEIQFSDGVGEVPKGFLIEERQDMKGKVMGLKTVEQNEVSTFSHYSKVE